MGSVLVVNRLFHSAFMSADPQKRAESADVEKKKIILLRFLFFLKPESCTDRSKNRALCMICNNRTEIHITITLAQYEALNIDTRNKTLLVINFFYLCPCFTISVLSLNCHFLLLNLKKLEKVASSNF
jgi:hypothetical protein